MSQAFSPPPPARFRPAKFFLAIAIWCCCIGLSELILAHLPVTLPPRQVATSPEHPYLHYFPNTSFLYSRGPLFDQAVVGRVNNAGFINPQQYETNVHVPLVGIVGDSYVEAQMLSYDQSTNGRLDHAFGPNARVYSFGISSAPASQYLAYAHMAAEQYHLDYLIVSLNSGDFYESLLTRWPARGLYQFDDRPGGEYAMHLTPYQPQAARELLRSSALARYFVLNLQLPTLVSQSVAHLPVSLKARVADITALTHLRPTPKTVAGQNDESGPDARHAADLFLQRLPGDAHLPVNRIVLVFDAYRPFIYAHGPATGWTVERRRVMQEARALGYQVVDLEPPFLDEYARTGNTVDIPDDGHWTARGHEIVTQEILKVLPAPGKLTKY